MRNGQALLVAALVVCADQLSKYLFSLADRGFSLPLWEGVVHLTVVYNFGAGFGILQGQRLFFILFSFAVLAWIFLLWKKHPQGIFQIPLGLLLGGIIGNLIDRIFRGYVIDFIDFQIWPVFNLADSSITIAVIWIIIIDLVENSQKKNKRKSATG